MTAIGAFESCCCPLSNAPVWEHPSKKLAEIGLDEDSLQNSFANPCLDALGLRNWGPVAQVVVGPPSQTFVFDKNTVFTLFWQIRTVSFVTLFCLL